MTHRGRLVLILGFLGIVALVIFGLFYLNSPVGSFDLPFLSEPPVVVITQPTSATTIYSGNGLLIGVAATSESGIDRIDFLVNGQNKESIPTNDPTLTIFSSSILWFSNRVGPQILSVVAYDVAGRASQVASINVNVSAVEDAQVDGLVSNDPSSLNTSIIEGAGVNGEGEPGFGVDAEAILADQHAQGDQSENQDPAQDQPPAITFFDYDLDLIQAGATITWFIRAEDDLGVQQIDFSSFLDGAVVFYLEFDCGSQPICELELPGAIQAGVSWFSIKAVDTSGQVSDFGFLTAEVIDPQGQPPAAAEHEAGNWRDVVVDLDWPFFAEGFAMQDFFGQFSPEFEGNPEAAEDPEDAENVIEGNLADIELNASVAFPDRYADRILIEAQFPTDFPWPDGDRVQLRIDSRWGQDQWRRDPGVVIDIGQGIRGQEFILERIVYTVCGNESFGFHLVLSVDGQDIEVGQTATILTPVCAPLSPLQFRVAAQSDGECPGNVPYCVALSWSLDQAPAPEGRAEGGFVIITRKDRLGFESVVRLGINETQYIDSEPTWIWQGRHCVVPDQYSIRVFPNQGSPSVPLRVDLPNLNCIDNWDFQGEESRAN